MGNEATAADSLRLKFSGSEIQQLHRIRTIPGVSVLAAAGKNGVGAGNLRSVGDGTFLQWRAPGSGTFGPRLKVTDGNWIVKDGEDLDKWVRVEVFASFLKPSSEEAQVLLDDVYNNGGNDDITAAEATAGFSASWQMDMVNESAKTLHRLVVWIDPATSGITISDDDVVFVSPTTEATGLEFGDLAPGGSLPLYIKRTIGAGASEDPRVLDVLQFSYISGP